MAELPPPFEFGDENVMWLSFVRSECSPSFGFCLLLLRQGGSSATGIGGSGVAGLPFPTTIVSYSMPN